MECFAATNAFWIDPQGYTRPCARNKTRCKHITEYDSFDQIQFPHIVQDLKNNIWPDSCFRCKLDEQNGIRSKREYYVEAGMLAPDDYMIDISMGNYCNLKCRMCNPRNSTLWAEEYKILEQQGLVTVKDDNAAYMLKSSDIDKIVDFLATIKGNIHLELKGGEPLIMPHTQTLLNKIIQLPNADRVTLLLVTNGTYVPDWLEQVSNKIHDLQLIVSIDAVDELFDYIRGNAKFSYKDCIANVEKFLELDVNVRFNTVVQNLNIFQLHEIYTVLDSYNKPINWINLTLPDYLAVNVLPDASRKQIYDNLITKDFGKYKKRIDAILKLLNTQPASGLLENFYNVTNILDQKRKEDIHSVNPYFKE